MSFFDKVRNLIVAPDDDDYQVEEEIKEEELPELEKPKKQFKSSSRYSQETKFQTIERPQSSFKIQVQDPLKYDDAPRIIDHLKAHNAVIVNFEHLTPELKRAIFDFISGGVYAVSGKIQQVTKDIFILAPKDVAIEGVKEEILESGLYTW